MRRQCCGFTLVEVSLASCLAVLLAALAMPSLEHQRLKAGRADGTSTLSRLQQAQEQYRATSGLYATSLAGLGAHARSPQGRYVIDLSSQPDGYVATAHASGSQSSDMACQTLTLTVRQGFASYGPDARCWGQ